MPLSDTAKLIASLELQDKFTRTAANAERAMDRLDARSGSLSSGFGRIGDSLGQMGRGVGQVGRGLDQIITRGAFAAAAGIGAVVTAAVSFEDAFAGVRKTVDATEPQFAELEATLREMARTIPVSFEELSAIAEAGGALGIAREGIDEFTRVVADLAATTDLSAESAATSLGVLGNVLNLQSADFDNFGSALVDLGNKGASTESAILDIAERIGATGSLIGLSADQVLGFGAAVANVGIEAEAGGSALQRFFIDALTAVESGGEDLETFAKTAGVTAETFRDSFRDDAGAALSDFIEGLGKLPDGVQIQTLSDLGFNDVRITRTLLGLAGDVENLEDSLNISAQAFAANSALGTEAAKRYQTTASQLKILKQNFLDIAVTVGDQLLPVIGQLTTDLVAFINRPETQRGVKEFGENLASGIRDFIGAIKDADFGPLLDTLKGAASIARGAFDAFRSLPPEVQALALAAFGINKVTGGALGDIAKGFGNIFAGGLKILFERGASPTNPMWVQSVGGIGGGAPGAPTRGGGAGRLLLGLTGVGLAAMLADEFEEEIEGFAEDTRNALGIQPINLPSGPNEWQWPFGNLNAPEWARGNEGIPDSKRWTPEIDIGKAGSSGFGVSALQSLIDRIRTATTVPDTAMGLPDTAMRPVTTELQNLNSDLTPKLSSLLSKQDQVAAAIRSQFGLLGQIRDKSTAVHVKVQNNVQVGVSEIQYRIQSFSQSIGGGVDPASSRAI